MPVATTPAPSTPAPKKPEKTYPYVAGQVMHEGFDEVQRLILAAQLGINVAIDGPPGVGKTQSVIEVCRVLGKTLYTKTCSNRTNESHIISFPVLTQENGVSVTRHMNGPLARAMLEPGVFYGDEFNLLKEDVQKRLNSAFDDRRSIDRNDGAIVKAKPGFWAVISYNPTEDLAGRDLENSVADRFVHFHYDRWDVDLKAYVSASKAAANPQEMMARANPEFNLELSLRGYQQGKFYTAEVSEGKIVWRDFFSRQVVAPAPSYVYQVFDQKSVFKPAEGKKPPNLENLAASAYSEIEFARMLSRFTELLFSLSRYGESPLLKRIGLHELREKEDLDLFAIHESSTRIEAAALRHYQALIEMGCNRYIAQAYATHLVVDQLCYGRFRERKLRDATTYELVLSIARAMRLLTLDATYNTRSLAASLLKK